MTSQGTVNTLTVSGFTSAIQRAEGQASLTNWDLRTGALTPIECHPLECTVAERDPNLYYLNNKTLTDNTGDIREKGRFKSHSCNHPACTPFYYPAKHPMMREAAREALNVESVRQGISVDPSRWKLVSVKLFPEITLTNVESMDLNDSREAREVAHGKPCNSLLTFGVFDKEGLSRHNFDNGPICFSNVVDKVKKTFSSEQQSGDISGGSEKAHWKDE